MRYQSYKIKCISTDFNRQPTIREMMKMVVEINLFLFERFDVLHIIVSKYCNKIDKVYILKSSLKGRFGKKNERENNNDDTVIGKIELVYTTI